MKIMGTPITITALLVLLTAGNVQAFTNSRSSASPLQTRLVSTTGATPTTLPVNSLDLNLCSISAGGCPSTHSDEPVLNNRHSASDWLYNVRSLPQSKVLREIRNPVLSVAAWSFVVSIVQRNLALSTTESLRSLAASMCIPGTAHGFLVSALGLLLVFRTNSAYQRFYEGRKIWENILSNSRNLSRMVRLYSKEIGPERKRRILNFVAAYPYLLRHHIRPGCLCEVDPTTVPETSKLLLHEVSLMTIDARYEGDSFASGGTTDLAKAESSEPRTCYVDRRKLPWSLFGKKSGQKLARSQNRPLWVCDRIGREMVSVPYGPNFTSRERLTLLSKVEKLTDAVGQCERIHQTAVPLNYARHSLRSLTLWLFTLPFALVGDLGLLTAPVNACIAWLLFGVYQIGYSIEDPFQGSLRLSILCDAIRRDVLGAAADDVPVVEATRRVTETVTVSKKQLVEPILLNDALQLVEPLLIDEELLNAPKILQEMNGTWSNSVVGVSP